MPAHPSRAPSDRYKHLPSAYAYVDPTERSQVVSAPPRVVFIEVTNHCNLLCETCPRTFVTYEEPQTLSWENFLKIVVQFPDVERVVLHGIGEPLINRDLPDMVRYLKDRGITVLFNTNATLLTEAWARQLIDSQLDELRCSLDAAHPRTYAEIRGAPLLHKIIENITRFTALQRELGRGKPIVSIWMTGLRENITELPDLVRLAATMGVGQVYVQRMVYYIDEETGPGMLNAGHGLFDDFDQVAEQKITEAEAIAQEHGILLRASGATDPRRSLEASSQRDQQPWRACMRPWTTAYVTANGNCLPCCISPFATTDYESLRMGNLFEQEFVSIWNDTPYQVWREQLLSEVSPEPCRGCGVHWSL